VVDEFRDPPRMLVGEVFGSTETLRRYCGDHEAKGLHLVFLFKTLGARFTAPAFRELIAEFEALFPDPFHPTYVFGNHDRPRSIERLGLDPHKARLLAMLQLTVRGVPFIYYGDEIGMPQLRIPKEQAKDPVSSRYRWVPDWLSRRLNRHGILLNRDECRPPMAWDHGPNSGFTDSAEPWLPVHPDSHRFNVAAQAEDPTSLLNCYRRLLHLRRTHPALHSGTLELLATGRHPASVLGYRRVHPETDAATVLLNFSADPAMVDLRSFRPGSGRALRMISSHSHEELVAHRTFHRLRPFEGVVLLASLI
jgi:alpha-glucosidase